jgi:biopolymer transport protein ExbD
MPKIKKKRVGFVLDLAPLVDIAFLLLTFFMFTAKFKSEAESEQKFKIERPKATADTTTVPEENLATIKVAIDTVTKDTNYYFALSNEKVRERVYQAVLSKYPAEVQEQYAGKALIQATPEMLKDLVRQSRIASFKTKFAVDADAGIQFHFIEDLMDIMRKSNATAFNLIVDKNQGQ